MTESHVFSAGGFEWKLWVKPFSGPHSDHVGLYLVPAADLDAPHTADFSLAIVGRQGRVLQRGLCDGRAKLHKGKSGHGWPTFIARADLECGEPPEGGEAAAGTEGAGAGGAAADDDGSRGLLHADGRLIATCSGMCNVRPRGDDQM